MYTISRLIYVVVLVTNIFSQKDSLFFKHQKFNVYAKKSYFKVIPMDSTMIKWHLEVIETVFNASIGENIYGKHKHNDTLNLFFDIIGSNRIQYRYLNSSIEFHKFGKSISKFSKGFDHMRADFKKLSAMGKKTRSFNKQDTSTAIEIATKFQKKLNQFYNADTSLSYFGKPKVRGPYESSTCYDVSFEAPPKMDIEDPRNSSITVNYSTGEVERFQSTVTEQLPDFTYRPKISKKVIKKKMDKVCVEISKSFVISKLMLKQIKGRWHWSALCTVKNPKPSFGPTGVQGALLKFDSENGEPTEKFIF